MKTALFAAVALTATSLPVLAQTSSGSPNPETVMMLVNPGGTLQGAAGPTGSAGSAGAGSAASGSGTPGGTSAPPPANRPQ